MVALVKRSGANRAIVIYIGTLVIDESNLQELVHRTVALTVQLAQGKKNLDRL